MSQANRVIDAGTLGSIYSRCFLVFAASIGIIEIHERESGRFLAIAERK